MTNRYQVRLAFNMDSESPGDAVEDVIDTFVEKGFRDLVYVVADASGKQIGYFNGWGEQLDVSAVEERAAQLRAVPAAPSTLDDESGDDWEQAAQESAETEPAQLHRELAATQHDEVDDAELEHLAESLNRPSSIQGFPISPDAEVTEMPAGSGWQWLVKDGDTYWGVNEDPGDQVFIDQSDYDRDLQAAHIPEG